MWDNFENSYELDHTPLHSTGNKPIPLPYQEKGFLVPLRAFDIAPGRQEESLWQSCLILI
ncbi:unnamed protein product [marine sediment metagenome]|uniref:Uncharacterized protein n=1 Tax=marine sediment metagenome TaxID=412755 RepID=X1V5S4_9ZZZZ